MLGLIIEGVLAFAFESARCKRLKEAYVDPVVAIVRFQGWASPHRLNSQLGLSQRDARFVLIIACQRGLIFQAVNGRYYLAPAQAEPVRSVEVEATSVSHAIGEVRAVNVSPSRRGWKMPLAVGLGALGLLWAGGIAYTQLSIHRDRSNALQAVAYSPSTTIVAPPTSRSTRTPKPSEQLSAAPTVGPINVDRPELHRHARQRRH